MTLTRYELELQLELAPLCPGEPHEIGHFGTFVVNTLRLEKGFKMWGSEMNCDVDIIEAGLDNFVRWNKKVLMNANNRTF